MSFWQGFRDEIRRTRHWLDPRREQDDLFKRVHCFLWGVALESFGLLGWAALIIGPDRAHPDPFDDWLRPLALLTGIVCTWWGGRLLLRCMQSVRSPKARFTDKYLSMYAGSPDMVPTLLAAKLLTLLIRLFGVRGQRFDDAAADDDPAADPDEPAGPPRGASPSQSKLAQSKPFQSKPSQSKPSQSRPSHPNSSASNDTSAPASPARSHADLTCPDQPPAAARGAMFAGRTSLLRRDRHRRGSRP